MKKNAMAKAAATLMAAVILAGSGSAAQAAENVDTQDNISLWVGDSRTVLIYQDLDMKAPKGKAYRDKARVSGGYLYLTYRDCYAARGSGYDLAVKAMTKAVKVAGKEGRQNVVLSSGLNDLYKTEVNPFSTKVKGKKVTASPEVLAKKYWKLYKKNLIKKYPEDRFYITSLNPVYCPLYYRGNSVTNDKVIRFNKKLKSLIAKSSFTNVSYVDTYKYIFKKQGLLHKKSAYRYALKYRTTNVRYMRESSSYQLHYSDKVNKMVYNYVNQFIGQDE